MINVIQIKNPRALLAPEVERILRAATSSSAFVAPGGFDAVAGDFFEAVTNENYFLMIAFDGPEAKAVTWGFFPPSRMFPYPTIQVLYSEGSRETLVALKEKLLELLLSRGYTTAWAVNITGNTDAAWAKLFEVPGKTEISRLGSLMQLSIK